MSTESQPLLTVKDVTAWRAWLDANEHTSDGVWLVLAKKGTVPRLKLRIGGAYTAADEEYVNALQHAVRAGLLDEHLHAVQAMVDVRRRANARAGGVAHPMVAPYRVHAGEGLARAMDTLLIAIGYGTFDNFLTQMSVFVWDRLSKLVATTPMADPEES